MSDINEHAFLQLFREACLKCFNVPLSSPLSETDSRVLANAILEKTGLVIGVKSIKNYSFYVLNTSDSKKENPSVATLDTLARYVLEAPFTNEASRKGNERHHPYWFKYRAGVAAAPHLIEKPKNNRRLPTLSIAILLTTLIAALIIWQSKKEGPLSTFVDSFHTAGDAALSEKGWRITERDTTWWSKKEIKAGHLTLFTMIGDNWPGLNINIPIRNLVVRELEESCFSAELQFSNFSPRENWQQAGMILSEDEDFSGKLLRISFSYNDFFGGYPKDPEVIIQGLYSTESSGKVKPEEFVHEPILTIAPGYESIAYSNFAKSAIKIEKRQNHFRILHNAGPSEGFAFKEVARGEFDLNPRFVGLFAIQGLAPEEAIIPVHIDRFSITGLKCGE
ncbi:MAG: hypothetical protein WKF87_09650 [Chryseolinea sp.]